MSSRKFAKAKIEQSDRDRQETIERVRVLRIARFGPRGQAAFCKALGISASTYHYYEHTRVPPPGLLVRMAQAGQTNLTWLLTGQGSMANPEFEVSGPAGQALARISRLLQDRPAAGGALVAFADLLEKIESVQRPRASGRSVAQPGVQLQAWMKTPPVIPVLGRAAAAVPQFWSNIQEGAGLTNQLGEAVVRLGEGERVAARSQGLGATGRPHNVAIVQLAEPADLAGLSVAEVVESAALVSKWPEAFALRIEGDSMLPILRENDLVVVSPKVRAKDGEPAVVQLAGQIGVMCKVYRRAKGQVRLIPVNPVYPTTVKGKDHVVWALRVLARVRAGNGSDEK